MVFQAAGSIEYCEQQKDAEPEDRAKNCPRCDGFTLAKVKFLESDAIFLHYCRNCGGFWLDGGDLKEIDKELEKTTSVKGNGFSDFLNEAHIPYWIKRVKEPSSETDFNVEAEPIAGAKLVAATTDACPNCDASLNRYSVFSMEFEGCPKCKGIWLTKEELRKLKNEVGEGSTRWLNNEIENIEKTSVTPSKRFCVKDKTTKMVTTIFGNSSILIDWCPQCHGLWLDRGEFEAINRYLKDELGRMQPKDIENMAAEDLKRVWSGGPEGRLEELIDANAAVSALVSATIFEHPLLFALCNSLARIGG
jgi:Zn-finger nucleic acid-binding protein